MEDVGETLRCKMALSAERKRKKKEVCESVLAQLLRNGDESLALPAFVEELQAHFNRLPTR